MPRTTIETDRAPAAIGPYSQAVTVDGWIYCSGQIPLDPVSGALINDSIESATRQVLANLAAVLGAAGAGFADVVKTTLFLTDMNDFPAVNALYAEAFGTTKPPARACVAVQALPKGAIIEIEAIAYRRPS